MSDYCFSTKMRIILGLHITHSKHGAAAKCTRARSASLSSKPGRSRDWAVKSATVQLQFLVFFTSASSCNGDSTEENYQYTCEKLVTCTDWTQSLHQQLHQLYVHLSLDVHVTEDIKFQNWPWHVHDSLLENPAAVIADEIRHSFFCGCLLFRKRLCQLYHDILNSVGTLFFQDSNDEILLTVK